jgi:hypothetical protein
MFGSILLIGLFSLLVINALKDKSRIVRIETKEDCFYFRVRNFDTDFAEHQAAKGLEIYKNELEHRYTLDLVRIQNQFILDTIKLRKVDELKTLQEKLKTMEEEVKRAAANAAAARDEARRTRLAVTPAPPPPAPTVVEGTLVIGIENRSPYIIRVTADKIPGSWTIKPGDEVLLPPLPKATDVSVRAEYLKRGKKIGEYTQVIPANLFNQKLCITRGGRVVDVVVFFGWN